MCNPKLTSSLFTIILLLTACSTPSPQITETPPPQIPATVVPSPPTKAPTPTSTPFSLSSAAFTEGANIPDKYAFALAGQCAGENYSPPLAWKNVPAGTRSFAIVMIDPDGGNWTHWLQFNLPVQTSFLPEAIGGPRIGVKGKNDFGELGYGGPCPPGGNHRYIFTIYALDTVLLLTEGATKPKLAEAMTEHVLGQAQLTGMRKR